MAIIARCRSGMRGGLLALSLFSLWPVAEGAAQSPPSLGYAAAKSANPKRLDVFKQGLTELGYVEGKNIRIDYCEGVLDADYHAVMAEFVGRKMNIILAANAPAAVAAAKATSSIPIVMFSTTISTSSPRRSRMTGPRRDAEYP